MFSSNFPKAMQDLPETMFGFEIAYIDIFGITFCASCAKQETVTMFDNYSSFDFVCECCSKEVKQERKVKCECCETFVPVSRCFDSDFGGGHVVWTCVPCDRKERMVS